MIYSKLKCKNNISLGYNFMSVTSSFLCVFRVQRSRPSHIPICRFIRKWKLMTYLSSLTSDIAIFTIDIRSEDSGVEFVFDDKCHV